MAEVKWIKIVTDIFNDEKIKLIESMPEADSLLVIWFKILCLAGNTNQSGLLIMNNKIHYTDEMLSSLFNRPLNTVRMGLEIFQKFGMIEIINNCYYISNWEKHQNVESLDKVREQTRLRVSKHRQKLLDSNVTSNVTVTDCNATEEDKELDIDIELDKDKEVIEKCPTPYEEIKDLYNSICKTILSEVKFLSDNRKTAIKTAWTKIKGDRAHKIETITTLFTKASKSKFLTGSNDRGWRADFDWLIKEKNMFKVLEGSYDNRKSTKTNGTFNNFEHRPYDGSDGTLTFIELERKLLGLDEPGETNEQQ